MGEDSLAGMYILEGTRGTIYKSWRDSCEYVKVGDKKQDKFCFADGDLEVACHRKIPSLIDLKSIHATRKAIPVLILETVKEEKSVEGMKTCSAWDGESSAVEEINGGKICSAWDDKSC